MYVRVCMCECVSVRACVRVRACVHVCFYSRKEISLKL